MDRESLLALYAQGVEAVGQCLGSLEAERDQLRQRVAQLEEQVARLSRDSTTSHRPPASDGPGQRRGCPARGRSGRRPGGQRGHPGRARPPVPPAQVERIVPHRPTCCAHCQQPFDASTAGTVVERRQVLELPDAQPFVEEHQFVSCTCACGEQTRLPVPPWISRGQGLNLQAHVAYYTGVARLSRRLTQTVLAELHGVSVSLGGLQNQLHDTTGACAPLYDELQQALPEQPHLHIDETGYPHQAKLHWLWVFVAPCFVFFALAQRRSSAVLKEYLGRAFAGIVICDRFSAYLKYSKDCLVGLLQHCWAHLIREAKALGAVPAHGRSEPFARLVRRQFGAVLRLWHATQQGRLSRAELIEKTRPLVEQMRALFVANQAQGPPAVAKYCAGVLKRWESLWTFLEHEGVEPTNNRAERMIRPAVQTRKLSFTTRSQAGQRLRAVLLTVTQSCRLQGRNGYEFLRLALRAHRGQGPRPSLLHPPSAPSAPSAPATA